MKFYNREEELSQLKKIFNLSLKRAQFTVITGRRRIGKTRLIFEATKNKKNILYFFVSKKSPGFLLEEFTNELKEKLNLSILGKIASLEELIRFLFEYSKKKPLVVIFDEFQNFKFIDSSLFSILQKHWDLNKEKSKMALFCIGSLQTLMKKIFLSSKEPLFGRINKQFLVKYLSIPSLVQIFKDFRFSGAKNFLHFYSIFGGVPKYFELVEELKGKNLKTILKTLFFQEDAILQKEGKNLLIEELSRNYQNYFSILEAIARGCTRRSEITNITGISPNSIGIYLDELENYYEFIERKIPIFQKKHLSKLGLYKIKDNFLRFWFRYLFRFSQSLEAKAYDDILNFTLRDLSNLEGFTFELLIKDILVEQSKNILPFKITNIGSFWNRKEDEIDIVCANEFTREIFFGECKLSSKKITLKSIKVLRQRAKEVKWYIKNRKEYYGVFTIDKINQDLKKILQKEKVFGFELEKLLKI